MTVITLVVNEIDVARAKSQGQVISCVMNASVCHHALHANHWYSPWVISLIIGVKSNVTIIY